MKERSYLEFAPLQNRDQIEAYLRAMPDIHVYSLGDLDDDLWPHTEWFGAIDNGKIEAICMVFSKYELPVIHAISEPENGALFDLISAISDRLPDYSEIHLSPAAEGALDEAFELIRMTDRWKMALRDRSRLDSANDMNAERLGPVDVDALRNLYNAVYFGSEERNVFYPSMLNAGPYFGVREGDQLVSAAGVHVYSPRYGVAAVANVATHPDYRGRGLASTVTARLCRELTPRVAHIGLNVVQSNEPALRAYRSIGFDVVGTYREGYIKRRT